MSLHTLGKKKTTTKKPKEYYSAIFPTILRLRGKDFYFYK